eukprot:Skav220865  [mRNA]  locus=scaffold193:274115:276402:+ [translate_table: standard]
MFHLCTQLPGGNVTGIYEVLGQVDPVGRSLIFEPIPDSWKEQPKNFVMAPWTEVGTQGVVSGTDDGTLRNVYAGTVPIYGCDSFELFTEAQAQGHAKGFLCNEEKSQKPNEVAQIFEAARQAGLGGVEFTTNGGEEIVLQLKR